MRGKYCSILYLVKASIINESAEMPHQEVPIGSLKNTTRVTYLGVILDYFISMYWSYGVADK